jgi:glycosyltransferase involved in cell wall biosynthesis
MAGRVRRADVAVYAPFAGALYAESIRSTGGAEYQSSCLARTLADHGYRVAHVVLGDHLPARVDGVQVVSIPNQYLCGGLRRRSAVLWALRAADARLYVQRSAGFETGMVGGFARANGRPFVFSSSANADFLLDAHTTSIAGAGLADWKSRLQYRFGLCCADRVVVQTGDQRELARRAFDVEAVVVPSFGQPAALATANRDAFLWVGTMHERKDPLSYVRLAEHLPHVRFRMLAVDRGGAAPALAVELERRAANLDNLEVFGARPRSEVLDLYATAVAVVNTSELEMEGFPNVFLEGWARGVPALSLKVDPDRTIERHGLGATAGGSFEKLVAFAGRMWKDRELPASERVRAYVERVHSPERVGAAWAGLVGQLLGR